MSSVPPLFSIDGGTRGTMANQFSGRNVWEDKATVETLIQLWKAGHSASIIAAEIGGGVSRNAVIAKAHRLGIAIKGERTTTQSLRCIKGPGRKPRPQTHKAASKRPPAKILVRAETVPVHVDDVARKTLQELQPEDCRYPVGTVGQPGFGFCALPKMPGSSLCSAHHARCWKSVPARKPGGHFNASIPHPSKERVEA